MCLFCEELSKALYKCYLIYYKHLENLLKNEAERPGRYKSKHKHIRDLEVLRKLSTIKIRKKLSLNYPEKKYGTIKQA